MRLIISSYWQDKDISYHQQGVSNSYWLPHTSDMPLSKLQESAQFALEHRGVDRQPGPVGKSM